MRQCFPPSLRAALPAILLAVALPSCILDPAEDDRANESIQAPEAIMPDLIYGSIMLDVDSDGDTDIVFSGQDKEWAAEAILLNDGSGFFDLVTDAFPDHYLGGFGAAANLNAADFDSDGHPDILATVQEVSPDGFGETSRLQLFLGNGDGTFRDASDNIAPGPMDDWAEWLRVADLDNDGHEDFLLTQAGCPVSDTCFGGRIYLNDGNGSFNVAQITATDTSRAYADDRLVWSDHGGLLGFYDPEFALDVFVGDMNNDGQVDLVAPSLNGGAIATFINHSTPGNLSFAITYTVDSLDPYGDVIPAFKNGALLDIDGDGYLDVVGSQSISGGIGETVPLVAMRNLGDGRLVEDAGLLQPADLGVSHARQWLVADFDQDGQDDLFIADHGYDATGFPGQPNMMLQSNGDGVLVKTSAGLGQASTFTHGASVGDLNDDGFPDLFLNHGRIPPSEFFAAATEARIWLSDGSGGYLPLDIDAALNKGATRSE